MRMVVLLWGAAVALAGFTMCAGACETAVLTHTEIASDPARAVEFYGPAGTTRFGYTVCAAGDANGDGIDDFVLSNTGSAGSIFLFFGRCAAAWANATFDFNATESTDAAGWIKISGSSPGMLIGAKGIVHGDFNGDGFDDLLFGAAVGGKAFCIYGHGGNWSSSTTLDIENGAVAGFTISGSTSVMYVNNAGDMNGDGVEDLLVTEYESLSPSTASVVFGVTGAERSDFDLSAIDGTNGFSLTDGSSYLGYGLTFGSVGDVNGDGMQDLAIGSCRFGSNAGRAYVVFARNTSDAGKQWPTLVNLTSDIDGSNGFIVDGPFVSSYFGWTVVGAGDVNADGFADIFVGSNTYDPGAWIIFGHPAPWTSPLNASQLDGTNGFHFKSSGEAWGYSGGSAGDVNSDGFDDIIIGGFDAYDSSGTKTGAAIVLFGRAGSWPAEISQIDAVGSIGFFVEGPSDSAQLGSSASSAGDVNGDGIADFIVGAYKHSSFQGYAALVFGTPDDHCAVCSNTTEVCLACADGFFLNSTSACINTSTASSSSSSFQSAAVVVIEIGGGGSAIEVAEEVAQLLGVDVGQISVVEITPGTFEVTVINEEVAQQLVTLVTQCVEGI